MAVVVELYPTATCVPRNLLRLYVLFSAPMSEGSAAQHVHLLDDATGDPLDGALLDMTPELWDPSGRRLTLFLDPGRIKRGLAPHVEAGYPLTEGISVRVRVDRRFCDSAGLPLEGTFERGYGVGADVRVRVDPSRWDVRSPAAGTTGPVTVSFDRPLDHALAQRCIRVVDPLGDTVTGTVHLGRGEVTWQFVPDEPWRVGEHRLDVAGILEDLAGNSVNRVFDRDIETDPTERPPPRPPTFEVT